MSDPYVPALQQPPAAYNPAWATRLTALVNALAGKANNIATVTLAASATSTTMTDSRLFANSCLGFMPTTANAAAVWASIYVDTQKKGSAVIHHTSDANTDKTFTVAISG
jgi:hypothetical protein